MRWREVAVKDISLRITKGTTPTTLGKAFTEQGVRFIKAEALNGDSGLDEAGFAYIDEETNELLKRSILQSEDVLLTIAGAKTGMCGFVREEHLPANTNQAVAIVRVDAQKGVPKFVYYLFKRKEMYSYIQSLSAQAAQPNLNLTRLGQIRISLPPYDNQRRIASILSAYDDLIENNRRRIQLLKQTARLLYKEWFVHLRFPGHEHVKIKDGVPEGWEKETLADVAESVRYGYTASAQAKAVGPKFLRITDIVPEIIDWNSVPHCEITEQDIEKFRLQEGDVVVARTGATVGYAKRIGRIDFDLVFASYLVRLRFTGVIDDLVAGIFMESKEYKAFIRNNCGGAAQPNANAKVISSAPILVPLDWLQKAFRQNVEPLSVQRELLQKENLSLRRARDLLLPRLMNGEISV